MDPNVDARPPAVQDAATLPLLARFPRLAQRVERLPLARLPTPVERLPLAGADAWIKRDDLTGEAYGGNKVRKLEFLLPDARAAGATRLITIGAYGSHHALATTVYGRQAGFDVTVVLGAQPMTPHVQEVLDGMRAHGAELRMVGSFALVPAAVAAARLVHRRERVRLIAPGGSDPIGTLGYVNAALELAEQCRAGLCPTPREIHVAGGTLGTAVGLALGVLMAGLPSVVVAHRITSRVITNRRAVRSLVLGVCRLLRAADPTAAVPHPLDVRPRLRIEHAQIGRGYGFETEAGAAAAHRFADAGYTLDQTYTAKAAAGFLAAARPDAGPVLFWHTLSSVNAV